MIFDLLILGAGPAGLAAALAHQTAHPGGRVLVLDRMPQPGVKLAVTGGGRGNLSHRCNEEAFAAAFGRQGRFTLPAFRAMPPEMLARRFADLGLPLITEPDGRMFPRAQSAARARDVLFEACRNAGVEFCFNRAVTSIQPPTDTRPDAPWRVEDLAARCLLLAAGGQSTPALGSDGSGFALARSLGHSIVPPVPALSAFHTVEKWPALHSGLTLEHAVVSLPTGKHRVERSEGGLLFTHQGISGPAVLNLSGRVSRRLAETGAPVTVQLSLLENAPDFPLLRRTHGACHLRSWLADRLPQTLAATLLEQSGIPPDGTFSRLTAEAERRLAQTLTALPLCVARTAPFAGSMVTSGGVALSGVRPNTLESRIRTRLFFAGEILDLDAPTGGYNLHWAFASGFLAGGIRRTSAL